jgi:hypothetical protein
MEADAIVLVISLMVENEILLSENAIEHIYEPQIKFEVQNVLVVMQLFVLAKWYC